MNEEIAKLLTLAGIDTADFSTSFSILDLYKGHKGIITCWTGDDHEVKSWDFGEKGLAISIDGMSVYRRGILSQAPGGIG